ncbi:uncharacterized protein LOC119076515 isoform X2 [Bradysia coprophila]|nr:uncharacterized protein LOC119076515 isoform X2 [Bradysia coprophila]XP_037039196.1 uncharacterized protein LOC119076515 isoform X2 [Bradysia coprophila]
MDDLDDETLNSLRYYFLRILVPCVAIIGILGNFVSVVVLTRRRMRCSTNIYLTALAVADIIYLLFVFILSWEHHPNIHHLKYKIYWAAFGLSHWISDASVYTSIYLTVSFTIERYIACCHPLIGQVLCTESRAKRVIAVVALLCFALTITTPFEYKLKEQTTYYNKSFPTNSPEALCPNVDDAFPNVTLKAMAKIDEVVRTTTESDFTEEFVNDENAFYDYNGGDRITKRNTKLWEINGVFYNQSEIQSFCVPSTEIFDSESDLGKNPTYKSIFYPFTSIVWTIIPVILLATFNCFLVAAVRRSHRMRRTMTNTIQSDRSTAQENKVTVTLIAVVVLFLVCQTPGAIQLIYSMKNEKHSNLTRGINIVCNFLTTLNAAANFLLYCALSNKYRQTVKELFLGRKRKNTMSSRYGSNPTGSSYYSKSPTNAGSASSNSIRKQPKNSRFSITPTDYANFQAEMAVKNANTKLLAAADFKTEKNSQQNSSHIQMQPLCNESSIHPPSSSSIQQLSPSSRKLRFHISPSETSLTRAQSLVFPIKIKHSPNCKSHPNP